jgi:hypothetical protein
MGISIQYEDTDCQKEVGINLDIFKLSQKVLKQKVINGIKFKISFNLNKNAMKKLSQYFVLALATAMFVGCAQKRSLTVASDQRQDYDMSEFRTYDWISEDGEMRRSIWISDPMYMQNDQNQQSSAYDQNQQNMQNNQNQQDTLNYQNQQNNQYNQNQQRDQYNQNQQNNEGNEYMHYYMIFHNPSNKKNIKGAIETQLEAKGFSRDSNDPDLLISYMVLDQPTQLRTFTRDNYTFLGEGPAGSDIEMVDVEPGTIIVNFTDAETGSQVWQGFASGALEESDMRDERSVQAKIAAIFEEFDFSGFSLGNSPGVNR